jgi:hypothetical protein
MRLDRRATAFASKRTGPRQGPPRCRRRQAPGAFTPGREAALGVPAGRLDDALGRASQTGLAFSTLGISASRRLRGLVIEAVRAGDSGPGMDQETLARVFAPLFSTRAFGVGLGLPLARQIMEQDGGGVTLEAVPGAGTCVKLWLSVPAADADAAPSRRLEGAHPDTRMKTMPGT